MIAFLVLGTAFEFAKRITMKALFWGAIASLCGCPFWMAFLGAFAGITVVFTYAFVKQKGWKHP